jgi:hypothetical protein
VIVIIDDNSNQKYITKKELYKTTIINSTYHGRGELLPYYYFLRYAFFDTAVIIHDSVFINQLIDFRTNTYQILWNFEHLWDNHEEESKILQIYQSHFHPIYHFLAKILYYSSSPSTSKQVIVSL